jgi:hypothetical protein
MEQKSTEQITMIVLRVAGVLTAFVGLVMTTQTIIQLVAARSAMSDLPGALPPGMTVNIQGAAERMANWAIVYPIAVILWGALLIALARLVAQAITKE